MDQYPAMALMTHVCMRVLPTMPTHTPTTSIVSETHTEGVATTAARTAHHNASDVPSAKNMAGEKAGDFITATTWVLCDRAAARHALTMMHTAAVPVGSWIHRHAPPALRTALVCELALL